jgi:hypothetical protein
MAPQGLQVKSWSIRKSALTFLPTVPAGINRDNAASAVQLLRDYEKFFKSTVQQEFTGVKSGIGRKVFLLFYFKFLGNLLFKLQKTGYSSLSQNMLLFPCP